MVLRQTFVVSERRACQVVGQPRATQRTDLAKPDEYEKRLTARILELKRTDELRRCGYKKLARHLRREGWDKANSKRVHRLWKLLGLQVPRQQKKRRRGGGYSAQNACDRLKPEYPNHVWSYDFKHDVTEAGQQLKFLVVMDEFTRRCLALRVGKSCKAKDVIATLGQLFQKHGFPAFIRSDNGPEFVSKDVISFLKDLPTQTAFIEPGSPWQNGYCESLNSQISSELTDGTVFRSVLEAKVLAEDYRHFYNTKRLHGALNYTTPGEFYQAWDYDQTEKSLRATGS